MSTAVADGDAIIRLLRNRETELRRAGIEHVSLFGSVARGEGDANSDIDIAVEINSEAALDLFALVALERQLGELLGRHVDLIVEPVRKSRLQANIDRDRRRAF